MIAICVFFAPVLLAGTKVTKTSWGKDAKGTDVTLYTITSSRAEVKVTSYGARIVSVSVPDHDGKPGNVIVGRDTLEGYMDDRTSVMGATIGRYANRIAGGAFELDGITYQIPKNNNGNALHGGTVGFDRKTWTARELKNGVEMKLVSPDGDMGFPGTLTVRVTFTLTQQHGHPALDISYFAETDKPTVVNFTNHAYFNLANDPATSVFDDTAIIAADAYTPVDDKGIPTGKVEPVAGTPYDFRTMHRIGSLAPPRGYDINFVLRPKKSGEAAAEVDDPASGRTLQVFTTEPGLQFFVPRFSAPPPNATGAHRPALAAFCLETQHFPDSPNQPSFPSTELRPGKPFRSTTTYVFGVKLAQGK
ncbi:MAG TPA: aldose epimerase family protein [Candidatus Acidoferrum sp.]|nr:aldose epimerase family protein [Candidatus Acidoferrum sp.]